MKNKIKAIILLGVVTIAAIVAILFSIPGDQGCKIYQEYIDNVYLKQNSIEQTTFNQNFIEEASIECITKNNQSYIVAKNELKYDLKSAKLVRGPEIEPPLEFEITQVSRFNIDQKFNEFLDNYYTNHIKID